MLLRYVVLFLNVLVAVTIKLTPGWGEGETVQLGGIYWITPSRLRIHHIGRRVPCIVFLNVGDSYLVARMRYGQPEGDDKLPVMSYFHDPFLQTNLPDMVMLDKYYILPYEIYKISGGSEDMKLYDGVLTSMTAKKLEEFRGVFRMVDGRIRGLVPTIRPGGLYWIDFETGTHTAKAHIPCVVFPIPNKLDTYRVFKMNHRSDFSDGENLPIGEGPAGRFFSDQKMQMGRFNVPFSNFLIHNKKFYEVKIDDIRRWAEGLFAQAMKKEYVDILLTASVDRGIREIEHRLSMPDSGGSPGHKRQRLV